MFDKTQKKSFKISKRIAYKLNSIPREKLLSYEPIYIRLEHQRDKLIDLINDYKSLRNNIDTSIIKDLYKIGIDCTKSFLGGDIANSIKVIGEKFFTYGSLYYTLMHKVIRLNPDCSIGFRIRYNKEINGKFSVSEMKHIPFNLRSSISNNRYSIAGYPCLYSGNSMFCSWVEIGKPKINHINIVTIKAKEMIAFLDLTLPIFTEFTSDIDIYRAIICWMCSFQKFPFGKSPNRYGSFREEYIIPQMVLSALMKSRRNYRTDKLFGKIFAIWGIKYTSSLYSRYERIGSPTDKYTNFVIPPATIREEGCCPRIDEILDFSDVFKITDMPEFKNQRHIQDIKELFYCVDGKMVEDFNSYSEIDQLPITIKRIFNL